MHAPSRPSRTQSFTVVLLIELWERFGYYGMSALLLLFMVQRLGFRDSTANLLWGAFAALTYASPAIGGWIGDQVIGSRRCMVIGAAILALGYLFMSLPSGGAVLLYVAMGTIAIGNGMFKPNAANMVRRIYEGDDARLDGAFTIYYMAVNVGSTVSILLCPWLKDQYGWHVAFAISFLGLVIGLANFTILRARVAHVGSRPDFAPMHVPRLMLVLGGIVLAIIAVDVILQHPVLARDCVWLAALVVLGAWVVTFRRSTRFERPGLLAMYLLTLQVMLFFIFYQQMSTSLTLFALRNVDLAFGVGGFTLFHWSPAQFSALDPIWIMVASPPLAWLYNRLGASGRDLPIAGKYVVGFALVAAGFLIWWLSCRWSATPLVSPWIMVWGYLLLSLAELLISGLGLAVVARYVPARMSAFMMGAYFLSVGVAMYIGSWVANYAALPDVGGQPDPAQTLPLYGSLFFRLFLLGCGGTVASLVLLPIIRRLDAAHQRGEAGA